MARVHLRITGRVQGVCFRDATRAKATALDLSGWVRNRPDGSVETEFEGSDTAVESLRDWCGQGPSLARVDAVSVLPPTPERLPQHFEVR